MVTLVSNVTQRGLNPKQVCLSWPVVCGLLTLGREDSKTGVQVIWGICSLKLGTVKQSKDVG